MYKIVENHKDFIAVSKSNNVNIHVEDKQPGLIVELKKKISTEQLYPVHRLDKVTSGLLICAKHQDAARKLSLLFQNRKVEKFYIALTDKKPKKKQGAIIGDMEPARRSAWKLCHTKVNPAVTQFVSYALGAGKRAFLLKPYTGKTHQLRVALKSLSAPIIGDSLYGSKAEGPIGEGSIYLHALSLGFNYQGVYYRYLEWPNHWQGYQLMELSKQNDWKLDQPWELSWPIFT